MKAFVIAAAVYLAGITVITLAVGARDVHVLRLIVWPFHLAGVIIEFTREAIRDAIRGRR